MLFLVVIILIWISSSLTLRYLTTTFSIQPLWSYEFLPVHVIYSKFISSDKLLTAVLRGLVSWRDASTSNCSILPLRTGLDENHLRWPAFNQNDLTKTKETLLVLLMSRAGKHPKEFAFSDNFPHNEEIAGRQGLVRQGFEFKPGDMLVTMTTADNERGDYGTIHTPGTEKEARELYDAMVWTEFASAQTIMNQGRIYRFLEEVVTRIMSLPTVPDEDSEIPWELNRNSWSMSEPQQEALVNLHRDTMHYSQSTEFLLQAITVISYRQFNIYRKQLRDLKSDPRLFYEYICDIREHSHHQTLYSSTKQAHAWVSHVSLRNLICATPERGYCERALANGCLTG